MKTRYRQVSQVLWRVFALNLVVATAKIALGLSSGAVSILACWEIFQSTSDILADRYVIPEAAIRDVVRSVPEVTGCHHIRTRGSNDF